LFLRTPSRTPIECLSSSFLSLSLSFLPLKVDMWPHFAINPDAVPPPEHRQRMIRAYLTAVHTTETSSAVFDAGPSTSTIKEISGVTPPVEAASQHHHHWQQAAAWQQRWQRSRPVTKKCTQSSRKSSTACLRRTSSGYVSLCGNGVVATPSKYSSVAIVVTRLVLKS